MSIRLEHHAHTQGKRQCKQRIAPIKTHVPPPDLVRQGHSTRAKERVGRVGENFSADQAKTADCSESVQPPKQQVSTRKTCKYETCHGNKRRAEILDNKISCVLRIK